MKASSVSSLTRQLSLVTAVLIHTKEEASCSTVTPRRHMLLLLPYPPFSHWPRPRAAWVASALLTPFTVKSGT